MDIRLAFWALSLALLGASTGSTFAGWRYIRQGRVERHRRAMNLGAAFIGLFLVLYLLKLTLLGREDLAAWSSQSLLLLRVHETFIAIMFVATSAARWLSRRLRRPDPPERLRRQHRLWGRLGAGASCLGFLTAAVLFLGMVQRAGS